MRIQPSPLKRTRLESISSSVDHQPSSSPHGARGSPGLPWSYAAHRARGELGKRRDPEPSRIGAEVCSPSTVSFCRMQLLEARFVPFRRKALGGSIPSWLWVGYYSQCKQGFFMPNQPTPRRRRRLELVSSCGDHQPSSSAHGARGTPDPPRPYADHRATGEIGPRGFPVETYLRAGVCDPNTLSLCSMQLQEARFEPFRRRA